VRIPHPCKNCDKLCVEETTRNLVIRVGEHKKEVESKDMLRFTRISKKAADEQQNKTTVTEHATKGEPRRCLDGMKVLTAELDRSRRL